MADPPSLDVVVVSYRCEELLRDCLTSLLGHPPRRPMTIQVVDNASNDGTTEMVAREFPEVELTACAENLGFAAANNVAIRAGRADYVLALNPDTRLGPDALERMCALMDEHPEIGISGPRLEQPDGTFDHASRRSFPTPLSALGHFTGLGRRPGASGRLADYRAPTVEAGPVDAVNGAFMLVRRSALDQVGLFDERYWMYMEDLDLCYRFHEAGWVTWFEPGVTVVHVKAGTSGSLRTWRLNYAFHRGMLRFYRDHYARERNPVVNATVYAGIGAKLILSAARSAAMRALARVRRARA